MKADAVELVDGSARLAEQLVKPLGRRWSHVQAVARAADELRAAVSREDGHVLLAAAWLHDVGYAPELADTGLHAMDGARFLRNEGFPERVVNLVAHHSGARFEAAERGLDAELAEFRFEDSAVMDALITADLTTGPNGERVEYSERIAEILRRYPEDDPVSRAWSRAAEPIGWSVRRTRWRLAAVPHGD